jgi:hypothetical protein
VAILTIGNSPPTQVYSSLAYNRPTRPLVIVNYDPTNPIYYSDNPGSISSKSSFIPAGSFEVFDGHNDVWMSTLDDNVSVMVDVKYGSQYAAPTSTQQPSSTPPNVFSASIGSGSTVDLIGGTGFPKTSKQMIQMKSLSISSGAATVGSGIGTAFCVEDIIADSTGIQYLANEVALGQGEQGSITNSIEQDMSLAVVPAGRKLQLINGGAGGNAIDRRCSATVVFYLVADPGE